VVTAAVILCFPMDDQRFRVLDNHLLVYLGNISYLLYLWHWPILMISKNSYSEFKLEQTLLVLLYTVFLSVLTHHLFENPLRHGRFFIKSPKVTIVGGLTLILTTALFMRFA
jgi:peptidoglycan/LPS O-acetylase OafA/YrhL